MKHNFTFLREVLLLFLFFIFSTISSITAQTVTLSSTGPIAENGGVSTITATATPAPANGVTITVTISDGVAPGTATGGTDYTLASTSILIVGDGIATNTGTTTITTAAIDGLLEGSETVVVDITAASDDGTGAGGDQGPYVESGTQQETISITDTETISLSGTTSISENGGSATLTATISGGGTLGLSGAGPLTLDLAYGGTAINGTDYTNVSSFQIANGAATGTFDIVSINDFDVESDETVIATISTSVTGVAFGTDNQTVTILDDDFLTAPVNGLTGVSVEPTFTWVAPNVGGADYTLEISTVGTPAGFGGAVIADTTISGLTHSFRETHSAGFPLDNDSLYYWRVTPTGGTASDIFHFTTIPSVPTTLTLPLNSSTVNMTDVTFYWYIIGSQGSMKFNIQVFEDDGAAPDATDWLSPTFEDTLTDTNKLFTLLQGKTYYWRVVVLSSGDEVIDYSSTWLFTTGSGTLVTPIPSWPIDSATVYTTTPTLYWYTNAYAAGMEFQVRYATDPSVTLGELDDAGAVNYPTDGNMAANGTSDLSIILPALTNSETYYWQVRVYDPVTTGFGDWSIVENFVTQGAGTLVVPIASYPTDSITVYTTAPTLYWYIAADGTGLTYNIDIELLSDSLDGVADSLNVTSFNKLISGLTAGESYIWQVQSDNNGAAGGGESAWSDVAKFTITGGVGGGYPVVTWPVSNPTIYTTKPTIYWFMEGSSLGLTHVELRYKEGSNSADWSAEAVGTQIALPAYSYTFTTDLTEGSKYYFALASFDGTSYSAWDEDSLTIYNAADNISDPVLTSPIGGIALASTSPTLWWHVVGDLTAIDDYEVTYSTSDVFAGGSPTTIVATPATSYLALTGLTPGATYFWKVRSHYTNGSYSNYSGVETFVINPGSFAIQPIVGGPHNVVVNTLEPTMSWVLPAAHSATLNSELLIADNPEMVNAITIKDIAKTNYDISGLEIGKSYFWKVRTKTTDNVYSEYSGQGVFKVGTDVTDVEEPEIIPEKFNVSQNYPNPFNPSTMIKYSLPEAQFVTLRIYNMLGQEVVTLVNNEVEAGVHNVTWNGVDNSGAKVATGAYIYRVVAGNNVMTKKMLLLK